MRWVIIVLGLLSMSTLAVAAEPIDGQLHLWTITQTQHILRGDAPGSSIAAKISAARNEWRGFQILVRSEQAVTGIRIEPGNLRGAGGVIKAGSARLYRQHQGQMPQGTYRNEGFKPDWYPDALIPFADPATNQPLKGARIQAVPFDLPANQTHGFWIDLYVPADAKGGIYRGTYRVMSADAKAMEVPVELTVWDFALPATPTLMTEFGSPAGRLRGYYSARAKAGKEKMPKDWAAVETQCAELCSEHRMNATPRSELLRPARQADGTYRIDSEKIRELREFIDRYHVNAIQTPHPSNAVKDPVAEGDKLRAWLAAFDAMAKELDRPGVVFYTYLKDEPNTREDYQYVQKWGRAVRECRSVLKVLVVEQTWTEPGMGGADSAWGDLYGAVDIWCPLFSLHRQDSAEKRIALGEMVWTYTALCQGKLTPWWHIDFPLLNYRVPAWMAWRDHMTGLLYWGGMSYWGVDDPWAEAPYYVGNGKPQQGRKGIIFNGEGSLVYPASAVGYDGIVPTIRLKALRDSIEDFEYLAMLRRAGKGAEAEKIVGEVVKSFFEWEKDAAAYDRARERLAEMIVGGNR